MTLNCQFSQLRLIGADNHGYSSPVEIREIGYSQISAIWREKTLCDDEIYDESVSDESGVMKVYLMGHH